MTIAKDFPTDPPSRRRPRQAMTCTAWLLVLALGITLPVQAQTTGPLGSSPRVVLPRTITEAGGEFQVDDVQTTMQVFPAAERFEATATLQCTGTRGAVRLAAFILNGGRRATRVSENGVDLPFTHAGDFLVVQLARPLGAGQQRRFELTYTGKAHAVSSHWVKDYRIEDYAIDLRVLPQTGNLTAVANLRLVGTGATAPPRPRPTRPPGAPDIPRWTPPLLSQAKEPKLGLVLNNQYAVDRVLLANQEQAYTHAGGVVRIDLDGPIRRDEVLPVTIHYTGKIRNTDRNRIWDNFDNDPRVVNPLGAE